MRTDRHAHTTYSDGSDWREMARAAAESGLEAIGFTDHCILWEDDHGRHARTTFDREFRERRREFADAAETLEVAVLDGVEMTYDPRQESTIRAFLETAGFEYAIGSVHYADGYDLTSPGALATADAGTKREAVETYVDWQVRAIESELFDVLGHLDLPQRVPALRGVVTDDDYRRLASALADSRTVPEINAGRLDREYGRIHPHPDALEHFAAHDVPFVVGTDAHAPDQLRRRVESLAPVLEAVPVEIVELDDGRT